MPDLPVEPEKIVTKFSDIGHIVDAVLSKMEVPELNGRKVMRFFFQQDEFSKELRKLDKFIAGEITDEVLSATAGFTFEIPSKNRYIIVIKYAPLFIAFPAYMHELGHISTTGHLAGKAQNRIEQAVIAEVLAISFEKWACEEFNELYSPNALEDPFIALCYEVLNQGTPENRPYKNSIARKSYDLLMASYLKHDFKNFRDAHKAFKSKVCAADKIDSADLIFT